MLDPLPSFTPIHRLEFSPPELLLEIRKKRPLKKMVIVGETFRDQIAIAYVAPSTVKWIHSTVGYGLFAEQIIPKGAFVCEYMGVVRQNNDYGKLCNYLYRYPVKDAIGRDYVIDAEHRSTLSRFINHSYRPNLSQAYAYIDGCFHALLLARRRIEVGEQLLFNYGESYWQLRGPPKAF